MQAREVLQQRLRRYPADIQVHVFVASDEEEGSVHPEGAPTVCQQDAEFGEVHGYVVEVDGIAVLVARAGEDGGAGMEHDGDAVPLRFEIDGLQLAVAVEVLVGE